MRNDILKTKNGVIAGEITEIDGFLFVSCTGNVPVYRNNVLLKSKNHFGKYRPYILNKGDVLSFDGVFFHY